MDGIALAYSELPLELIERHQLARLVHERGGEREVHFLRHVPEAVLPVRHDGQLRIVPWGSRSGRLPRSGYTWHRTIEAGEWTAYNAVPVEIPATLGWHNGIWYLIRQGVSGMLARAENTEAVYVVVKPASNFYQNMTKAKRMPVLLGGNI